MKPPLRVYSPVAERFLNVGNKIGEGARGAVFESETNPRLLLKLYNEPDGEPRIVETISIVSGILKGLYQFSQIQTILLDRPFGAFLGVLVTRQDGVPLSNLRFNTPMAAVQAGIGIAEGLIALLGHGGIWTDANPENVFGTPEGKISFVDVDDISFLPCRYPDGVVRPRALERQVIGHGPAEFLTPDAAIGPEVLGFIAAELIYMALKEIHPRMVLVGGKPADMRDLVNDGIYGRFTPTLFKVRHEVIDAGIPWEQLPTDLRRMFEITFQRGYDRPECRFTCEEFRDTLIGWRDREQGYLSKPLAPKPPPQPELPTGVPELSLFQRFLNFLAPPAADQPDAQAQTPAGPAPVTQESAEDQLAKFQFEMGMAGVLIVALIAILLLALIDTSARLSSVSGELDSIRKRASADR